MKDKYNQILISIFGGLCIFLLNFTNETVQLYGAIIGLLGQYFWFRIVIINKLWGILPLTIWYTLSFIYGIVTRINF